MFPTWWMQRQPVTTWRPHRDGPSRFSPRPSRIGRFRQACAPSRLGSASKVVRFTMPSHLTITVSTKACPVTFKAVRPISTMDSTTRGRPAPASGTPCVENVRVNLTVALVVPAVAAGPISKPKKLSGIIPTRKAHPGTDPVRFRCRGSDTSRAPMKKELETTTDSRQEHVRPRRQLSETVRDFTPLPEPCSRGPSR